MTPFQTKTHSNCAPKERSDVLTKPPAFQLYAKDALEGCAEMSAAEFGVYWRLIFLSWGKGALPNDTERLARLAGCTPEEFAVVWPAVQPKWTETPSGLVNIRLERQRAAQEEYRTLQAERGRKGGRPVKSEANPDESRTKAGLNHLVNPDESQRLAGSKAGCNPDESSPISDLRSSSPISDLRSPTADQKPRAKAARVTFHDVGFELRFWPAYPRKTAKADALKAWQKLAPDLETIAAILAALEWQRTQPTWTKDGGAFVPHPSTWLNQRRWEDEPFHAAQDITPQRGDTIGVHNAKVAAQYARLTRPEPERPERAERMLTGCDHE